MDNIIGHKEVKDILKKMIEEEKVGHAYLFVGKEGIGKKLTAIAFAKQIMSLGNSKFSESELKMISPENDVIKVDEIRNLISEVYLKPTESSHKVFIIDDADKMNLNAQNALLKVLEEPPSYATIILIVANKEKMIKTILSRITEITFDSLSNEELEKIVGTNTNLEYARGSASKALELLSGDTYCIACALKEEIEKKDFLLLNKKVSEIKQSGYDWIKILEMLKMMYYQEIENNTYEKIQKMNQIDWTIKKLGKNANLDLALDELIIELSER